MMTKQEFLAIAQGFLLASTTASDVPRPKGGRRGWKGPSARKILVEAAVAAADLAGTAPDERGGELT